MMDAVGVRVLDLGNTSMCMFSESFLSVVLSNASWTTTGRTEVPDARWEPRRSERLGRLRS